MAKDRGSPILERGMPQALEAEKLILGSILTDDAIFSQTESALESAHFSTEAHRTIYRTIQEVKAQGDRVDRVIVSQILSSRNLLESVGGLSYMMSLDDGIPRLPSIAGYIKIVREKAELRNLIETGNILMNSALTGVQPPAEIAANIIAQLDRMVSAMPSRKTTLSVAEVIDGLGGLQEFLAPRHDGIPTGFPLIDEITYGILPKRLHVIGGDSGHGKSALLQNMLSNMALGLTGKDITVDPNPVALFNLEMDKEEISLRFVCARAGVSSTKVRRGWLKPEDRRRLQLAAGEIASAPIHIDDESGISIKEFVHRLRRLRKQGVRVFGLDYLQLLNWREDGMKSEYEGVSYATATMKKVCKDEDCAIIALSQFHQEYSRRKDKTQRPTEDSLHGAGSIKKDADVVMLIYRLAQAHPGVADKQNQVELLVPKHRQGRRGMVLADYNGPTTTFTELPEDQQPEKAEKE